MSSEETLEFTAAVIVQELWNGDWRSFPLGDPELVAHGVSMEGCLAEQRAVLELHLSEVHPAVLSRFSIPDGASLREVRVEVDRLDLPERQRGPARIAVPTVVVPLAEARWVLVPTLDHAFRLPVDAGDKLGALITEELQRVIAARDPSAQDFLDLLPVGQSSLERLTLQLRREHGRARESEQRERERRARQQFFELLESVSTPLHKTVRIEHDLVGRDAELQQVRKLLSGSARLSVAMVGPELSGKSSIFRRWLAEELVRNEGRPVFATSGSQLIAGMSGHGQWEERIQRVLKAAEELDAILYFEGVDDLLAERETGGVDVAGAMKRALEEGRVRVVAELSPEALALFEKRQAGFIASFARVHVKPLDGARTLDILRRRARYQARTGAQTATLTDEAAQSLLDLTVRYLPYRALPGAAVRFEEELRALHGADRDATNMIEPITSAKVFSAFSLRSGIPEFLLREDRSLQAAEVEQWFRERLVGQVSAVKRIVETLCVVKANLQPQGKPLANLLFVGPTGVGKTELARLLATYLFGSPERLFRYDMSEYADAWAADRLLRGSARSEGTLTRRVRQQPFCVLLLDEIEKAHPAVFDLLLQLCGEGRLTDASGKTAYFHNAIVVMTSNLGAAHRRTAIGLGAQAEEDSAYYDQQVQQAFRPEFVNRLDRVIPFHPLRKEEIATVANLSLRKVQTRRGFRDAGIELQVDVPVLTKLIEEGYSPAYGARALRRHLEDALVAPASRYIAAAGSWPRGSSLRVSSAAEGLAFQSKLSSGPSVRSSHVDVRQIQRWRAQVSGWMNLERVQQVRERLSFLLSKLTLSDTRQHSKVDGEMIGALQEEQYRLNQRWLPALHSFEELLASEEAALLALQAAEDVAEHHAKASAAYRAFAANLPYLLLVEERRRDEISLRLTEQDDGRALDFWLAGLLAVARERRWSVAVYIDDDEASGNGRWWGKARHAEDAAAMVASKSRTFRNVLISVRGPFAGVLLALEAGLHRYISMGKIDPMYLIIQNLGLRTMDVSELSATGMGPAAPLAPKILQASPAIREYDGRAGAIAIDGRRVRLSVPPQASWLRYDEIALEHLLLFENDPERDRDSLFMGLLDKRKERAS